MTFALRGEEGSEKQTTVLEACVSGTVIGEEHGADVILDSLPESYN